MNESNRDQAERLIVAFLDKHGEPTLEDWKRLADNYPEHAAAIADGALVRAAGDAADASATEHRFSEELANKTVSRALNKAHQMPSTNLQAVSEKIAVIQGPTARKDMAVAVGIGPYSSLLNGVLAGRTKAARKVLGALADRLDVPATALREFFARTFAASAVPVFKATLQKPQVPTEPASWEQAVRGLKLSPEETKRLLKLDEDA